jgi:hypothetical protein
MPAGNVIGKFGTGAQLASWRREGETVSRLQ